MERKMIAKMEISLDGFIEGPNGEMDWVIEGAEDEESWEDMFEMLSH
jgi:hypothetical protein